MHYSIREAVVVTQVFSTNFGMQGSWEVYCHSCVETAMHSSQAASASGWYMVWEQTVQSDWLVAVELVPCLYHFIDLFIDLFRRNYMGFNLTMHCTTLASHVLASGIL